MNLKEKEMNSSEKCRLSLCKNFIFLSQKEILMNFLNMSRRNSEILVDYKKKSMVGKDKLRFVKDLNKYKEMVTNEKFFSLIGKRYLQELTLYSFIVIKLRIKRINVLVSVETNLGKVLLFYSFGRLFKKSMSRRSKHAYIAAGSTIGQYLKLRKCARVLIYSRIKTWRAKSFYKELSKYVPVLGALIYPIVYVGKRRKKRYKRKKSTRRLR